mmetsp:Transcript_135/g.208  ORF Transcript_135/g.208 Transcript_135/m.208 type:complete len:203 (-) Transcript_135:439-1047(-)
MAVVAACLDRLGRIHIIIKLCTFLKQPIECGTCSPPIARMPPPHRTIFDGSTPCHCIGDIIQGILVHGTISKGTCYTAGGNAVGDATWSCMVSGRGVFDVGQVLSCRSSGLCERGRRRIRHCCWIIILWEEEASTATAARFHITRTARNGTITTQKSGISLYANRGRSSIASGVLPPGTGLSLFTECKKRNNGMRRQRCLLN